jgi:hypothetical protein
MSAGQNAKNGERLADDATLSEVSTLTLVSSEDRLDYIAELVQELKVMSEQANCQTLADLLEQAYLEAVRQRGARA